MATDTRSPAKAPGKPQYESFVEQQLAKARQRIRVIDLLGAVAILFSIVCGYGLVVGLADRLWDLPVGIRLVGWLFLMAGVAAFIGSSVNRLWFRQVNPIFLANRLEQTVPNAKNSIINWLNLQNEPLPPVIRGSLGRRAAKDLTDADAEEAISAQPLWWLGGIAGALLLIQVGFLIASPGQTLSLLGRAFLPFEMKSIATRTTLTLVEPEGGDVAIPSQKPVRIRVQVAGHVPSLNQPDSLKLHFRYTRNEPFEERALTQDVDGSWVVNIPADQVRNGFFYKITGGDARLPEDREYRVDVRSVPQVQSFDALHQYRPYLLLPDKKQVFEKNVRPSFVEMRGTKTTLVVHANRELKQCVLELKSGSATTDLPGEPVPGDAKAWQFTWVLDRSGEFRVLFQSKDGEENLDRQPCKITAIPDRAPEVVIAKPAADTTLPANGTLLVEGFARDDFGVRSVQMRLKVLNVPNASDLKAKPYDVDLKLKSGKYLLEVDYKDFLALDAVQTAKGEVFPLAPGMELEYWLEARDNCDYPTPDGHLGQSKHFKVTVTAPEKNQEKVKQDRAAGQAQQQAGKKNVGASVDDHNAMDQARDKAGDGKSNQQSGAGSGGDNSLDKKKEDVQKALDDQNKKGESKGKEEQSGAGAGQNKQGPQDGAGDAGSAQGGQPGDNKQAGNDKAGGTEGAKEAGDSKGAGQQQSNEAGAGKEAGNKESAGNQKGDGSKDNGAGADKAGPRDAAKEGAADSKDKAAGGDSGKSKDDGGGSSAQSAKGGEKGAGKEMKDAAAGSGKGDGEPAGTGADKKSDAKGNPTPDASAGKANPDGGQKGEMTAAKGPGQQDATKSAQSNAGDVKGAAPTATGESTTKKGPADNQMTAKGEGVGESGPGSSKKAGVDKQAGPGEGEKSAGNAKGGGREDATLNDVSDLAKQLDDPAQRESARQGLEKIGDTARDPKVSQAADKALRKFEAEKGALKDAQAGNMNGTNDKNAGANPKDNGNGKTAKSDPGSGQTKDGSGAGKPGANQGKSTKPGVGTAGTTNQGGIGGDDAGTPNPFDQAAANRPDELQLELLKKKIDKLRSQLTPPVLDKLKWTEKDRDDFLRQLRDDALVRYEKQKKNGGAATAAPATIDALMPSRGPRSIGPDVRGGGGPPPIAPAEPPPDVRLANKIFQNNK